MGRPLRAGAPADPSPAAGRSPGPRPARLLIASRHLLECVANVSEGRDRRILAALAGACGDLLLDVHADPDHHRAVFTMGGPAEAVEEAARALAATAVVLLDLRGHDGHHPRFGVVDVVPFTPLPVEDRRTSDAVHAGDSATSARDRFAKWAGDQLGLPCFLYGPMTAPPERSTAPPPERSTAAPPERSLPEIRRGAFADIRPDTGPAAPHLTAGACAVGSRGPLIAYNFWVRGGDAALVRSVAAAVRGPAVRALGFGFVEGAQVSCNLVSPFDIGPAEVHDNVSAVLERAHPGATIERCEVVGLLPADVLERIPSRRWAELGLSASSTIEARLEERGGRPTASNRRPATSGAGEPDS